MRIPADEARDEMHPEGPDYVSLAGNRYRVFDVYFYAQFVMLSVRGDNHDDVVDLNYELGRLIEVERAGEELEIDQLRKQVEGLQEQVRLADATRHDLELGYRHLAYDTLFVAPGLNSREPIIWEAREPNYPMPVIARYDLPKAPAGDLLWAKMTTGLRTREEP